jgi:hypothetical protein
MLQTARAFTRPTSAAIESRATTVLPLTCTALRCWPHAPPSASSGHQSIRNHRPDPLRSRTPSGGTPMWLQRLYIFRLTLQNKEHTDSQPPLDMAHRPRNCALKTGAPEPHLHKVSRHSNCRQRSPQCMHGKQRQLQRKKQFPRRSGAPPHPLALRGIDIRRARRQVTAADDLPCGSAVAPGVRSARVSTADRCKKRASHRCPVIRAA